jgi:hypothetical protein
MLAGTQTFARHLRMELDGRGNNNCINFDVADYMVEHTGDLHLRIKRLHLPQTVTIEVADHLDVASANGPEIPNKIWAPVSAPNHRNIKHD